MENQFTEEQLKEIASQLGCPQGDNGLKTAERMNENNIGMTRSAIEALNLNDEEVVLEIGPGNAEHLSELLDKAERLKYFAVDISETMVTEAKQRNTKAIENDQAYFYQIEGSSLPFPTLRFDKVYTVNTIYFWKNPVSFLEEIKRVLRPGGLFVLCFADRNFMQNLPFTSFGFTLYDLQEVQKLMNQAGFKSISVEEKVEQVQSNANTFVTRNYFVVKGFVG